MKKLSFCNKVTDAHIYWITRLLSTCYESNAEGCDGYVCLPTLAVCYILHFKFTLHCLHLKLRKILS